MSKHPKPAPFGTVQHVEALSPSMVRIVFGGSGLDDFEPSDSTDQYVNARFVPDGAPYTVPFSDQDLNGVDTALRPKPRRFTMRRWDPQERLLTIDFVAHGDVGFAGRWAQQAQIGDRLQMTGPGGSYRPDPTADWYLLVGDESALPAIAATIESFEPGTRCEAIVVVDRSENQVSVDCPSGTELKRG